MLSHERNLGRDRRAGRAPQASPSGLARRAGLDPTSFNKSKRQANDGRFRWPSTESISKVLRATGRRSTNSWASSRARVRKASSGRDFSFAGRARSRCSDWPRRVPAASSMTAGSPPARAGTSSTSHVARKQAGRLRARGAGRFHAAALPRRRRADRRTRCAGSPRRPRRRQDARGRGDGQDAAAPDTADRRGGIGNPAHPPRSFPASEIEWMARIVWASQ